MKPTKIETKNIDMLMMSKIGKLGVYDLEFRSIDHQFTLHMQVMKVNKMELLSIDNPNYDVLIKRYLHLKGVTVNNDETKALLPIHAVFGSGEYVKIKTKTLLHIGATNAPIAELTKFRWFLMSPGAEFNNNVMMLTQTSQADYEELCQLDVLGL